MERARQVDIGNIDVPAFTPTRMTGQKSASRTRRSLTRPFRDPAWSSQARWEKIIFS